MFVQLVTEDLCRIPTNVVSNNLTSKQKKALQELQKMDDVFIKPVDKGGGGL